jgi:DNA-binding NtrC family response regulator
LAKILGIMANNLMEIMTNNILKEEGYTCSFVSTFKEAIETIKSNDYDLILFQLKVKDKFSDVENFVKMIASAHPSIGLIAGAPLLNVKVYNVLRRLTGNEPFSTPLRKELLIACIDKALGE